MRDLLQTLEGLASICSGGLALVLGGAGAAAELTGSPVATPLVPTLVASFTAISLALAWHAKKEAVRSRA